MTLWRDLLTWTGGAALLAATAFDTVAVVGRQVGFALHGAIELIQAAVLIAGSIALIAATAANNHASVKMVVERLGRARPWFEGGAELLTAAFAAALLVGSAWLGAELWNSHEVSEVAGVPWRWLRLIANIALAAVVLLSLYNLGWRRGR